MTWEEEQVAREALSLFQAIKIYKQRLNVCFEAKLTTEQKLANESKEEFTEYDESKFILRI